MALQASYPPFEGSTDEGHPGVSQPWWYPTSILRRVTHKDLDADAAGRQVPVDIHGHGQLSFHGASNLYPNLNYFNPWQEPLLHALPDTSYGSRTLGMPVGPDLPMNYLESNFDPIVAIVQGEPLPTRPSTNSQVGFFGHWQEPFPHLVSDSSNPEAGTPSQTFVVNSHVNQPGVHMNPIGVEYAPRRQVSVQNPSEPHFYFDHWQEPSFVPPPTSNVHTVGPPGSIVGLGNVVAANSYYSAAHDYTFSSFAAYQPQGQVPPQAPSSSWRPSYTTLWQEPSAPFPGPYIHPSVTSDLPFGIDHHAERYVSDAEARNDLAPLRLDQLLLGTTTLERPPASIGSPKPTASSIEGSGQPSSTPVASSSATTRDVTWRERRRPAEAKFSCTFCPSVFTAKHNYKYHMQAHRVIHMYFTQCAGSDIVAVNM
ncbi:hypothetical protein AB1N83_011005 [Pleurotus pulmonarius]